MKIHFAMEKTWRPNASGLKPVPLCRPKWKVEKMSFDLSAVTCKRCVRKLLGGN